MKIAMISPGLLPVPAVKGGAVEVLTEYLIDGNENNNNCIIDLYTVFDKEVLNYNYSNTNVIFVHIHFITKLKNRLVNFFYKLFHIKKWRTSFNREVVRILKNQEYDLVVIQNNILIYEDIYSMTKNKDNLVYIAHNNVNDGDETHIRIAKKIGDTAHRILTVSNYTKNNFLQISSRANIDVLYNCIDVNKYLSADNKRDELRNKYNIEENEYVFIYSGRIDVYKGVLELIKAFNNLKANDAKLIIVGKSWFDENMKADEYTKKLYDASKDLEDRIIFTGFISPNEMPYIYQIADCLMIPSTWEEPFGVVALEGMISKLPIIGTETGGLREVLNPEYATLIKNDENIIISLADAMNNALCNKKEYYRKGQTGFKKIIEWQEVQKSNYYNNFIEKLL